MTHKWGNILSYLYMYLNVDYCLTTAMIWNYIVVGAIVDNDDFELINRTIIMLNNVLIIHRNY